ncbi:VOC family protein [Kitasatospora sp. NPDC101801]|uniref:VOC family protein n=1 Tax=unclassified Kitasatospora TaxID=2633591 RepID=UPI003249D293
MLTQATIHTTLPVTDLGRAEQWYRDKLGMTPAEEMDGGALYKTPGGEFLLFPTPITERGGHTQVSFEVSDLKAEMAEMRGHGVVFEEYDMPEFKTVDGMVSWDGGAAAYCKDSEGNLLCVAEMHHH